jgi:AGZA family xanthine/uracil permease-like MFS transporter
LGVVFFSGLLFLLLSVVGLREMVLEAISPSLKHGIAGGIGLFIAFIGLQNIGLVVKDPGTAVKLNPHLASLDLLIFFAGLLVSAGLHARRVRGSILWGIVTATLLSILLRLVLPHLPGSIGKSAWVAGSMLFQRFAIAHAIVGAPPSLAPTFLKMDLIHAASPIMAPFVLVFFFMVLFDTVGTLIGVAGQAGFIRDNKLPRAKQAFISDALGTMLGACLGTSTVTSFIESAAGVEEGGRTGLTSVTVAAFFLLALFFTPLIGMVASYAPITAPALVLVGAMMCRNAAAIDWTDYTESIPAFLVLLGIPLFYSIADGLALGFMVYPVIKCLAGKRGEVRPLMAVLALLLALYFILVRGTME